MTAPARHGRARRVYRRALPEPIRSALWSIRAVPRRVVQRIQYRHVRSYEDAYVRSDTDEGPASPALVDAALANLEAAVRPALDDLDPTCGADRSVVTIMGLRLEREFNDHSNSFSWQRLRDLFWNHLRRDVTGDLCVEVGPGTFNPFAGLVLLALLGARQAIGLEPAQVYDYPSAAVGAARAATWLLTTPALIAGDHPVDLDAVRRNADQFDLERLWAGDISGLDRSVVELRHRSLYESGLADGSVDYVFSNSTLEHLARPVDAVAEMARFSAAGGVGIHYVDGTDHYAQPSNRIHPLHFLRAPTDPDTRMLNGSNRLRPVEYRDLFIEHGLLVTRFAVDEEVEVDETTREAFIEPWRSLPLDDLRVTKAFIETRKP